ncbi:MAG: hypothetical protein WBG86_19700 [Polyangiales bacterium]
MRTLLAWIFAMLVGIASLGCNDTADLEDCVAGACETQEDCVMQCENVCGDPDFGNFNCVENTCICQCFFGCQ